MSRKSKNLIITVVVLLVAAIVAFSSVTIVPTGYTGVKSTFGQISPNVLTQGIRFKIPFIEKVTLVSNKQQDASLYGEIWGETRERTPVFASDISVTYTVSSAKSAWIVANVAAYRDGLITDTLVSSAVKAAMVELPANEVTIRSKIEPLVKEKLIESIKEKYGEDTVTVIKVVVNNMDFEESYNEAIAQKSIAQQTYERQQIENETAIAKAEANKKVAITNAEAEAEAKLIQAQAEADANRLLSESLTDEVLRNRFYDEWDGTLPRVMGESAVITSVDDIVSSTEPAAEE